MKPYAGQMLSMFGGIIELIINGTTNIFIIFSLLTIGLAIINVIQEIREVKWNIHTKEISKYK